MILILMEHLKSKCPKCHKGVTFKTKSGLYKFTKYNRKCKNCCNKKDYVKNEFVRVCNECGDEMIYKTRIEKNRSDREGRICRSCASTIYNARRGCVLDAETKNKLRDSRIGKKLSSETKEILRHRMMGNKNPFFGKKHTPESLSENSRKNTGKNSKNFGKKLSEEHKEKLRLSFRDRLNKLRIPLPNGRCFNKNACIFIDNWGKSNGYEFQHAMNTGEKLITGYSVDGYDPKNNTVFEYDEKRHYNCLGELNRKDVDRMIRIIKSSNCKFIRYNEFLNKLYECRLVENQIHYSTL